MKDWYNKNVSVQEPLKEKLVPYIYEQTLKDYSDLLLLTNQVRVICKLYLDCKEPSFSPNFISKKGGIICYKKHDYWDNGVEFFTLIPVLKYNMRNKSWDLLLDKPTKSIYYGETHLQNELYCNIKRDLISHIFYYRLTKI